jgi:hypothetical protein
MFKVTNDCILLLPVMPLGAGSKPRESVAEYFMKMGWVNI